MVFSWTDEGSNYLLSPNPSDILVAGEKCRCDNDHVDGVFNRPPCDMIDKLLTTSVRLSSRPSSKPFRIRWFDIN